LAYVIATLVPVLALGAILTQLLRTQANDRGIAEGRTQAQLIARSTVAPVLDGDSTRSLTVDEYEYDRLQIAAQGVLDGGQVLRMRVRDLSGHIVYPRADVTETPIDGNALKATRGATVADLTRLDADTRVDNPGPRVIEVYVPLTNAQYGTRIGVLEVYLSYAPIASDIARHQRTVYVALLDGLALLWLCLIGVTASVIRSLRRETHAHAYLAKHDALTGLPNRAALLRHMNGLLDSGVRPVSVALLTVARFGKLSDALGRSNADRILVTLAERLREFSRGGAGVARLDGVEFAIVSTDKSVHEWLLGVRAALCEPIEIDGLRIAVDLTIGYDICSGGACADADTMLARAAVARTAARHASSGLLKYTPAQEQHDATALSLLAEVHRAIADNELVLHYQPKYDISTARIVSVEALIRWQHPTRGLLYPAAFIEAVEETEFIEDITAWVVRESCRAVRQLPDDVRMAVNVSARSLVQPEFAARILEIVRSERVRASRLILEVTETAVITDPISAQRTLGQLRKAGFAVSIDDFGAGQTSLSHLVAMPIDELKIDRAIVGDIVKNSRSAAVVRSVIELGHSLGISVTAEGVETEQILATLRSLGCDVAQGYFFSRPVPLAALREELGDPGPLVPSGL
jgi:diguanylate cyclase (GGDEF)-like protein